MKQKYVLYSLSDVAVPVLVTEMKFGPRKLKILSLGNWCFRVRHYEFMFQWARGMKVIGVAVFLFKPILYNELCKTRVLIGLEECVIRV